ncbi:winged helix-turn-helix transcriptional regulator [Sphingobium yanoikuyae]|jgi:DNA-binding HxlR family transcriptional regulator|uniref:winged helix-turn-helix transcriptional regulator n=1 Tax=Sphingobium yanoikuyae TaxID=13690 RepID=UPI0004E3B2DE|nr:helix-turn-helix domain-containing protein [Sphingobium yanoikuyae]KFD26660.1 HxlR family transcriptional regulator [Sphingobium yanoikuyae]KZC81507.1 HxlR family transcriptional regulator [Sphingobium yanoikuyae]MDV3478684.1 helix-turn-helix domain-containing protein [Sphingobium yanoikuyae]
MTAPTPLPRIGDAYDPDCPTRHVLDRIGDKWAVLVMLTLKDGPVRFNDLRRRIGAISQKMLSQTLKSLERDGLVSRAAYATVPVTVEYRLTEMAQGLIGILDQITRWAEGHVGAIMNARRAHDAREVEAA